MPLDFELVSKFTGENCDLDHFKIVQISVGSNLVI